jgi:hypothetical protein
MEIMRLVLPGTRVSFISSELARDHKGTNAIENTVHNLSQCLIISSIISVNG